ncbi:MAG: 30S ribosomal protein S9 [Candidatus Brocadiae bacterium]|nr:30S ribosomal protein S9 [Candidatus Brocadiia bacterium]
MADDYIWGTGRRKCSVAGVRIKPGTGVIKVNGRDMEDYFTRDDHQAAVREVLRVTHNQGRFDVFVKATGGGITGQAGAVRLGLARALLKGDSSLRSVLREHGLLTRDARMVERKKYGKRGARRSPQYSKR